MSTTRLFHNGDILAAGGRIRDGWLLVESDRITDIGSGPAPDIACQRIDLEGAILAPGMVDIHMHGALQNDTMYADVDGLRTIAQFAASRGVTAMLATTMAASTPAILRALEAVAQVSAEGSGGARIVGAHVEGPYLDVVKRGAQGTEHIRPASPEDYGPILDTGVARLVTLAPEYPENQGLIRDAVARGCAVSAGHTRATYEQMMTAVAMGVSQVTHLFNGMESLHHRSPGAVGAALGIDALRCQLIADLVHIHPAVLALAARIKGPDGIILVTDAMSGAGMPDGQYELGGQAVTVQNGEARLANGSLAGSTLTMDRAVRNMMFATGMSLDRIWPMASRNPAASIGEASKGAIRVGMDADLVVSDSQAHIALTMVEGEIVYRA